MRVVAVTKGFGLDAVHAALEAGLEDLGENYAGELVDKATALDADVVWHFLGAMQRNKVPDLAPLVGMWQSVAREPEGARIARFAPGSLGPGPGRHDRPGRAQRMRARRGSRAGRSACATSGSTCAGS